MNTARGSEPFTTAYRIARIQQAPIAGNGGGPAISTLEQNRSFARRGNDGGLPMVNLESLIEVLLDDLDGYMCANNDAAALVHHAIKVGRGRMIQHPSAPAGVVITECRKWMLEQPAVSEVSREAGAAMIGDQLGEFARRREAML